MGNGQLQFAYKYSDSSANSLSEISSDLAVSFFYDIFIVCERAYGSNRPILLRKMILFPNCKINLGLRILAKRADGYHELETVMYPVQGLCDALEMIPWEGQGVSFSSSGLPVEGPMDKNLCVRAYEALRKRHPLGGVKMHLHKVVPMGAGLGGGSADAAYVIRGLVEMFDLEMSETEMESVAAEIGSDTAFFVSGHPALATGRGEILSPVDLSLQGYRLVIVKPPFGVSTAQAYARVVPAVRGESLLERLAHPIAEWKEQVINDFEPSVFAQFPRLKQLKENLYENGALYAAMSGSGSALFGIFPGGNPVTLSGITDEFVYQENMA